MLIEKFIFNILKIGLIILIVIIKIVSLIIYFFKIIKSNKKSSDFKVSNLQVN